MAHIVIRNLEDDVQAKLRRRARRHGRSMEEEVCAILREALKNEEVAQQRLGSRIADRFAQVGLDEDIPNCAVNPPARSISSPDRPVVGLVARSVFNPC